MSIGSAPIGIIESLETGSGQRRSERLGSGSQNPAVRNAVSKSFVRTLFPHAVTLRDYLISIDALSLPEQPSMSKDLSDLLDETILVPPSTQYTSSHLSLSRSSSHSSGERTIKHAVTAFTSVAAVINRLVASEVRCAGGGGNAVSTINNPPALGAIGAFTAGVGGAGTASISGYPGVLEDVYPAALLAPAPVSPAVDVGVAAAVAGGVGVETAGTGGGDNILALGYRPKRWESEMGMRCNADIECFFVNTVHSVYYFSSAWDALLRTVGDEVFQHLLGCTMLMPLHKNDCYVQISGPPVVKSLFRATSPPPAAPSGLGGTLIPRHRVFYTRRRLWSRDAEGREVVPIHLPSAHVLRSKKKSFDCIFGSLDLSAFPEQRVLLEGLLRAMQEGYRSCNILRELNRLCPLDRTQDTNAASTPSYTNLPSASSALQRGMAARKRRRGCRAGAHVQARRCKRRTGPPHFATSLRFDDDFLPPVDSASTPGTDCCTGVPDSTVGQRLAARALRCVTEAARLSSSAEFVHSQPSDDESCCGASSPQGSSANIDDSIRFSNLIAQCEVRSGPSHGDIVVGDVRTTVPGSSVHLHSRLFRTENSHSIGSELIQTADWSDLGNDINPSSPPPRNKADVDFRLLKTPADRVSTFIRCVLIRTLPLRQVWGSRHNLSRFLRQVDEYVHLAKNETMSVTQVCRGLRVSEFPWLNSTIPLERKVELMASFLYWIFAHVVNPLLSSSFYVTEGEGTGNEVLYYRHSVWNRLAQLGDAYLHEHFMKVVPDNIGVAVGGGSSNIHFASTLEPSEAGNVPVSANNASIEVPLTAISRRKAGSKSEGASSRHLFAALSRAASDPTPSSSSANPIRTDKDCTPLLRSHSGFSSNQALRLHGNITISAPLLRKVVVAPGQLRQIPSVRFVPKKASMRPITNLRSSLMRHQRRERLLGQPGTAAAASEGGPLNRSMDSSGMGVLNNAQLYNCLHILRDIATKNPSLCGFGTLSMDDVYRKFREFRLSLSADVLNRRRMAPETCSPQIIVTGLDWSEDDGDRPDHNVKTRKQTANSDFEASDSGFYDATTVDRYVDLSDVPLYIAALDLDKCYDNVDTMKLFDLLRNIVSQYAASQDGVIPDAQEGSSGGPNRRTSLGDASYSTGRSAKVVGEFGLEACDRLVHKYSVTHYIRSLERPVCKTIKRVTLGDDIIPLHEAAHMIADSHRSCIITDGVVYPSISCDKLLRMLQTHLFSHLVRTYRDKISQSSSSSGYCYKGSAMRYHQVLDKSMSGGSAQQPAALSAAAGRVGDRACYHRASAVSRELEDYAYFTQVRGIPQGSVLSPILCNLYYGHAENTEFLSDPVEAEAMGLGAGGRCSVVRMMDDYLVISTQRSAALQFLQTAHTALHKYGGGVNPSKTRVANFDAWVQAGDGRRTELRRIDRSTGGGEAAQLVWCGLSIDTRTLEVRPHIDRLLERLAASVAVPGLAGQESGFGLRRAMKSFLRPKTHAIVLDPLLNSRAAVLQSIASLYVVAALRASVLLDVLHRRGLARRNPSYLGRCVRESVLFGARLIRSRAMQHQRHRCKHEHDHEHARRAGRGGAGEDVEESGKSSCDSPCSGGADRSAMRKEGDRMWNFNTEFDFSVVMLVGYLSFIAVFRRRRRNSLQQSPARSATTSTASGHIPRGAKGRGASKCSRPPGGRVGCSATRCALTAELRTRSQRLRARIDALEASTPTHAHAPQPGSPSQHRCCSDWVDEVVRRVSQEMFAKVPGW